MVNRDSPSVTPISEQLALLRKEYAEAPLNEADCDPNPIRQLERWLQDAVRAQVTEPNAMILATVGEEGNPSARAVLLKDIQDGKLIFYTSYESRKSSEMLGHQNVAAVFVWTELERQVRVEGTARKVSREQSERYFKSRPRMSQLAAATSSQSAILSSRAELETRYEQMERTYAGGEVPCPEHWGGFSIDPQRIEFWQGRRNRLHDRLIFERQPDGVWKRSRLWP